MKKCIFKPMAIMAISALTVFGCAGSSENSDTVDTGVASEQPAETTETEDLSNTAETEEGSAAYFANVDDTENYDILELAGMDENLSTFVELVELSGLDASLGLTPGAIENYTIFVPTNEAFENMDQGELDKLRDPENKTTLVEFIQRHVLPSEVPLIQFAENQIIETVTENEIPVSTEMNGTVVFIGGAQIIESDVEASNGMIHVVDGIIEPGEFTDVTAE